MWKDREQRAADWADSAWNDRRDDAREPVYPDGSVCHECWNSSTVAGKKNSGQKKPDSKKDRVSEDTRPD